MKTLENLRTLISIKANDEGVLPNEIEILQAGMWRTPWHGNFEVTASQLQEYADNFKKDVRASSSTHGLPIDFEHRTSDGAAGWITDLVVKGMSLWATIDWNKKGAEAIADKQYKFFSPEFQPEDYEDPERAGNFYNNVLMGGALTTRPLFKGLTPVRANDGSQDDKKSLTQKSGSSIIYVKAAEKPNNEDNMNLQQLLEKKASELTTDEQAFIKANVKELTAEQVKAYDFLDQAHKSDKKDKKDANDKKSDKKDDKKPVEGKDSVVISASEYKLLQEKADKGVEAADKIAAIEASETVTKLLFASDKPRLPIAAKEDAVAFYQTLSASQKEAFEGLVKQLPETKMFAEIGDANAVSKETGEALDKKASELMKANEKLTYSQALKMAGDQNPELAKEHAEIKE